MTIYTRLENKN